MSATFYDDPERDYRRRYELPEHFVYDPLSDVAVGYKGFVQVALSLLPEPPCEILDAGCGDGWVAKRAIALGYRVVGLDYSSRAVGFAKILVPGGEFHEGDVRDLARRGKWRGNFQAVLFLEVLEHIPPRYHEQVLSELGTCLQPGGTLVMSVPSIHRPVNPWHYKHFAYDETLALLERCGYQVRQTIHQGTRTFLRSPRLWSLLANNHYDLRFLRRWLARALLEHLNVTDDPRKASRYLLQAVPLMSSRSSRNRQVV